MFRRDEASASSVGLCVAAATIAAAFMTAQFLVAEAPRPDAKDVSYAAHATTGLALLVGDTGFTTAGAAWAHDPDAIARFGLAKEGERNFLDYEKVRALRNGTLEALDNDEPDYPEVKAALGLHDADFHLRTYPVLPGLDEPHWTRETHGRLAYFARHGGAVAPVALAPPELVLSPRSLNVTLRLTNDAALPAVFTATVGIGAVATNTVLVTEERHTRLLAPGETDTVWVEFPPLAWAASVDGVRIDVRDPYGNAAVDVTNNRVGPAWHAQPPPTSSPLPYGWLVHAASDYVVSGRTVTFHADHYKADGTKTPGAEGQFVLVGPDGDEWVNTSAREALPHQKNSHYKYDCTNCTDPGTYTAILWDAGFTRMHLDRVHVSATTIFTEKTTLDPVALNEIGIMGDLVAGFNPTKHDPVTNPGGDVFGDDANGASDLVRLLSRYTSIVIGSEVSQTALTPSGVKYAVAQWVQEGGNLVVLGTVNQQSQWLQPVYHAAQETANGGISAPDPTHPVLSTPNRLRYDHYLDRGRAWDIRNDAPFTHVLSRAGASGNSRDDTIAVSEPGAYNNGTVVLTSYMPGSLTSPQDDMEAKKLMHNLLSQSYTMLFLDYGPQIPPSVPVGSDSRLVAVEHPNVPGAVVEVRLVMYVFG